MEKKSKKEDVNTEREIVQQLTNTCQSYRRELQRQEDKNAKEVRKLTQENETIQLEMCRLQDKLDHWKSTCLRQQNGNVLIAKSRCLNKENTTLKQDMEVFKTVIRRLNRELSSYQEKLRKAYGGSSHKVPEFSSSDSNVNSTADEYKGAGDTLKEDDLKSPSNTLLPLLIAYDEVIEDKNEIIKDHERAMEKFKQKLQQIIKENEELHLIIAESKEKGSVSIEEWKSLYDNANFVLEANDLLQDKVEVLSKKLAAMESGHEEKVEKFKKKIISLEEEKSKLKTGLAEMDKQSTFLTQQITKMSTVIQQRIPKEEHEYSVNECQRLFDDLKSKYAHERVTLTQKLREITADKDQLGVQIGTSNAEIVRLQETVKNLEKSNIDYAGSLVVLKKELSISVKAHQVTEATVNEMMRLTESMVQEKEALEMSYNEQRQSTAKIMAVRSQEVNLIRICEEKMKSIEGDYEKKVEHHISRAKKLEDVLETIADRHRADLSQLHELVKEKNVHIEKLNTEKKQLQEDLETVWRASTREQNALNRKNQNVSAQILRKPNSSDKQQE